MSREYCWPSLKSKRSKHGKCVRLFLSRNIEYLLIYLRIKSVYSFMLRPRNDAVTRRQK